MLIVIQFSFVEVESWERIRRAHRVIKLRLLLPEIAAGHNAGRQLVHQISVVPDIIGHGHEASDHDPENFDRDPEAAICGLGRQDPCPGRQVRVSVYNIMMMIAEEGRLQLGQGLGLGLVHLHRGAMYKIIVPKLVIIWIKICSLKTSSIYLTVCLRVTMISFQF